MRSAPVVMMKNANKPAASSGDFFSVDEIGRISDGILGSAPAAGRLRMLGLQSAWDRAVGLHLKVVARPSSLSGARLVVDVRDLAWKRELDRFKPEILRRLAALLPSHPIADILCRVTKVAGHEPNGPEPPGTFATRLEPSVIAAPAGGAAEVDLRERFSHVMGRYLARAPRVR